MSLQSEIQTLMGELGKKVPPELMEKVGVFIERLARDGIGRNAVRPGQPAPQFNLRNAAGEMTSLADLLTKGPAVIKFFRGEWCPFCDLELRAYQRMLPKLKESAVSLVAISPQSDANTRSTSENRSLGFDVLRDPDNAVARLYGVAFSMNDAERELHAAFGADLPSLNASASWDLPIPATFVVNQAGRVTWAHVDPNYTTRAEPADVLRAIADLKLTL